MRTALVFQLVAIWAQPLQIFLVVIAGILVFVVDLNDLWMRVVAAVSAYRRTDRREKRSNISLSWSKLPTARSRTKFSNRLQNVTCRYRLLANYTLDHNHLADLIGGPAFSRAKIVFSYFATPPCNDRITREALHLKALPLGNVNHQGTAVFCGTRSRAEACFRGWRPLEKWLMATFAYRFWACASLWSRLGIVEFLATNPRTEMSIISFGQKWTVTVCAK